MSQGQSGGTDGFRRGQQVGWGLRNQVDQAFSKALNVGLPRGQRSILVLMHLQLHDQAGVVIEHLLISRGWQRKTGLTRSTIIITVNVHLTTNISLSVDIIG